MRQLARRTLTVFATLAWVTVSSAQGPCEFEQLTGDRTQSDNDFGRAIALHGDRAAVGDGGNVNGVGAVHVFAFDGKNWIAGPVLTPPVPQPNDSYGASLSIVEELLVVGAYRRDAPIFQSGAAFVYRLCPAGWELEAELTASDGGHNDTFGRYLSTDGTVIAMGAPSDERESVYVFRHDDEAGTWNEEAKLVNPNRDPLDAFGIVAVRGNVLMVGAPGNDTAAPSAGATFVYNRRGPEWVLVQTIYRDAPTAVDSFGSSVALDGSGTVAAIGARQEDGQNGSVYIFRFDGETWRQEAKLVAARPGGPFPLFGASVAITRDGTAVLGGAPNDFDQGFEAGAAHLFRLREGAWAEIAKLSSPGMPDRFGRSVAIDGDVAMVGATGESQNGAAQVYIGTGGVVCDINGLTDTCEILADSSADQQMNGVLDVCEQAGDLNGDATVDVEDLITLILNWGPCPGACPPACLGDVDGDCQVSVSDLIALFLNWG